jgi:DeoR/GlpR family transcriptional regulator of sugar metabolism
MVEVEQQMIRAADEVNILADRSKFGRRALARLCGWDSIDRIVSDEQLDSRWQEVVRAAGSELIMAGKAEIVSG